MTLKEPALLSPGASRSAARMIDEMSRLYYLSRAIQAAAALAIADYLGDGSATAEALAGRSGCNAAALERLLRFLSAYGVFEQTASNQYRNTELSSAMREDHPQSARARLRQTGELWWPAAANLEQCVRGGESAFTVFHGAPVFDYLRQHSDVQQRFDEVMARISDADDAAVAQAYDFSRFSKIIDVGGGSGGLLAQILLRAPLANGILFDQTRHTATPARLDRAGVSARANCITGDFFDALPEGGDCYVIKGVLHDFDDDACVKILSNCRRAMKKEGVIVIANQDLPTPVTGPHPNLTLDIQMLVLINGRERSGDHWQDLFRLAGLKMLSATGTDVGFTLIEGVTLDRAENADYAR